MTIVRFIRTTHQHGRHRSFPSAARQFWQTHGAVVGEVLRPETPLTFAEIVTAVREYALEDPATGLYATLTPEYIAWCLIHLLEHGMARAVGEVVEPAAQPQVSLPTNPLDERLLRLWGKTVKGNDQIYHPALYHLLDVGHVAQQLLGPQASPRWRRVLAAALNADSDTLQEWLPWVIALHDIGKLTVPFQAQNETQKKRLEAEGFQFGRVSSLNIKDLQHTITGRLTLNEVLGDMETDLPPFLQSAIEEMVSGHHGIYQLPNRQQRSDFRRVQEPAEWVQLRRRAGEVLQSCFLQRVPTEWPTPENVSAAIAMLNGFAILCDWLGSDENYFQPAPYQPLAAYLRRSQEQARARVQDAGFFGPTQSRKTRPDSLNSFRT